MFDLKNTLREGSRARASAAAAALGGLAAVGILQYGWRRLKGTDPPQNPAAADVEWREAVAWTVVSGLAIGLSRLAARRGLAAIWRRALEDEPAELA